jgi:hypothetical protein
MKVSEFPEVLFVTCESFDKDDGGDIFFAAHEDWEGETCEDERVAEYRLARIFRHEVIHNKGD